ncbi:MAG: 50S ribosomal protein L4 [Elusimicrobia bacterium]|nr:50S ribosomal protein L4 [Elusimicrobiota bacterium]
MELKVQNMKGEEVGKLKLPAEVFEAKPLRTFLHEVVTVFQTNQRSWTAHTKTRSEVSGGGKKPWKQKHTGRARAGSNRSPLWRKGGITFGPRYVGSRRMEQPRRKSRLALAQALSARASSGDLRVVDKLALDGAKTKQVAEFLKALGAAKTSLVVIEQFDQNLAQASRNVQGLKVMLASNLNAYEVLACDKLIVTQGALEKIRSRWN